MDNNSSILLNICGRLEGLASGLSPNKEMKEIVTLLRDMADAISMVCKDLQGGN